MPMNIHVSLKGLPDGRGSEITAAMSLGPTGSSSSQNSPGGCGRDGAGVAAWLGWNLQGNPTLLVSSVQCHSVNATG